MEVKSYEAHDTGLAIESLSPGFWLDDMHAECRTGEKWSHPSTVKMNRVSGNGFFWYDTNQVRGLISVDGLHVLKSVTKI